MINIRKKAINKNIDSAIDNVRSYKVPNQNIIIRTSSEIKEPYHPISEYEFVTAHKLFKNNSTALSIWIMYALQRDGYTILSGTKQLRNKGVDIEPSCYSRAIAMMKEYGYITQDPDNKDIYYFWTLPHNEEYKPEEEKDNYQAQFLTLQEEKTNKFNHITAFGNTPRQYTFDHDEGELLF